MSDEKRHQQQQGWCTHVNLRRPMAGQPEGCLWPGRTRLWVGWGDLEGVGNKLHPCGWAEGASTHLSSSMLHNSPSKVKRSFYFCNI